MHWKQRALCKPESVQRLKKCLPKKSVTFCLPAPPLMSDSPLDKGALEDEDEEIKEL